MSLHNPTNRSSFNVVCQFNNGYLDSGCSVNNNTTASISADNHNNNCEYQPSQNNFNKINNKLAWKATYCNNLYDSNNNPFVACSPSCDSSSSTNSSYDILNGNIGLTNFSADVNYNNWPQNDFNNYNYDEITTTFIASFKRHGYRNETLEDNFLHLSTFDGSDTPKADVNAFLDKSSLSYLHGNVGDSSTCIDNFFNSSPNEAASVSQFNYNTNNNNYYTDNNQQQQNFYTYPQPAKQHYHQNYPPLKQIPQPQKQKTQKHQQQFKQQSTVQKPEIKLRRTANARERDRTYNVNNAFHHLRSIIPTEPADRKLSKIETIRLATSYIAHLHTVINTDLHLHQQPCVRIRGSLTRLLKMRKLVNLDLEKDGHVIKQLMSGACEGADDGGDNGPTIICTFCLSASKAHSNGVTF